jgi:hypothetical protein
VMNGTGALRQFVPRSLGIAPGRPLAMASASLLTIRDAEIFKDHAAGVPLQSDPDAIDKQQPWLELNISAGAGEREKK